MSGSDEPLIDVAVTPAIFCEGIGPISFHDGMVHVTLWARQQRLDGLGFDRIVVGRIAAKQTDATTSLADMVLAMASGAVLSLAERVRKDGH